MVGCVETDVASGLVEHEIVLNIVLRPLLLEMILPEVVVINVDKDVMGMKVATASVDVTTEAEVGESSFTVDVNTAGAFKKDDGLTMISSSRGRYGSHS